MGGRPPSFRQPPPSASFGAIGPPPPAERAGSGPTPMDLDVSGDVIDVEAVVGDGGDRQQSRPSGPVGAPASGGCAGGLAGARQLPPPPPPPQRPLANHVRECAQIALSVQACKHMNFKSSTC